MGGEFTYPKMVPLVLNRSQMSLSLFDVLVSFRRFFFFLGGGGWLRKLQSNRVWLLAVLLVFPNCIELIPTSLLPIDHGIMPSLKSGWYTGHLLHIKYEGSLNEKRCHGTPRLQTSCPGRIPNRSTLFGLKKRMREAPNHSRDLREPRASTHKWPKEITVFLVLHVVRGGAGMYQNGSAGMNQPASQ